MGEKRNNPFMKTSQGSIPQPYYALAQGTYSNDNIFNSMQAPGFGWGNPLTCSNGFYNPFSNSGYNSPKNYESAFPPSDRFKGHPKMDNRRATQMV